MAARKKAKKDTPIFIRPRGTLRAVVDKAVKLDPKGRTISDLFRDALFAYLEDQPWFKRRTPR